MRSIAFRLASLNLKLRISGQLTLLSSLNVCSSLETVWVNAPVVNTVANANQRTPLPEVTAEEGNPQCDQDAAVGAPSNRIDEACFRSGSHLLRIRIPALPLRAGTATHSMDGFHTSHGGSRGSTVKHMQDR